MESMLHSNSQSQLLATQLGAMTSTRNDLVKQTVNEPGGGGG